MSIKVDWAFLVQSRTKIPVHAWFKKNEITTYEQAVSLLKKNKIPVGSREEVAKFLPASPEINDLLFNSDSSTSVVVGRLAKKNVDKGPKSAAEEAADAITASAPAKTNKTASRKKSATKRKSGSKSKAAGKTTKKTK